MNSSFKIGPISQNAFDFDQESMIVLQKIDRIPPHIGMIINGMYSDINIKGYHNQPASAFLKVLNQKMIPAIFIALRIPENDINFSAICKELKQVDKNTTCLMPVKIFFSRLFGEPLDNLNFIFDLIPYLEKKNAIKNYYGININQLLKNNYFYLKKYDFKDIQNCIEHLTENYA